MYLYAHHARFFIDWNQSKRVKGIKSGFMLKDTNEKPGARVSVDQLQLAHPVLIP